MSNLAVKIFNEVVDTIKGGVLSPSLYRGGGDEMFFWDTRSNIEHHFSYNGNSSIIEAYKRCPVVSAIVTKKTSAFINGKRRVVSIAGKGKANDSNRQEAKAIRRLFKKPNMLQFGRQFDAQVYSMQQLYSHAIVYFDRAAGLPLWKADAMFCLPNWLVDIKYKKLDFTKSKNLQRGIIEEASMVLNGTRIYLPVQNIVIIKDSTPTLTDVFVPTSRIEVNAQPINNIIGALETEGEIINNRGPALVVSSDKTDHSGRISLTPKEKEESEQHFKNRYGWRKGQVAAFITAANVKITPVGFNVKELGLNDAIHTAGKMLCDSFGYPPHLMGLIDPTYQNQRDAQRGLYMNTIIPEAEGWDEQWSVVFDTEEFDAAIVTSYDHVAAMQYDLNISASARRTNAEAYSRMFKDNLITLDEYREYMDLEKVGDENGKKYYHELVALGIPFGENAQNLTQNQINERDDATIQNAD